MKARAGLVGLVFAGLFAVGCSESKTDRASVVDSLKSAALAPAVRDSAALDSAPAAKATVSAPPASASAPAMPAPRVPAPRHVMAGRVDLTGIGYDRGSPTAPVVIVNFSDFGCPYCGSFAREIEPAIERDYVQTGKVFFKYVPFVMGSFPNGRQAARAGECAGEQGKFWPMHDLLYQKQDEWKRMLATFEAFQGYARSLGLDVKRFSACYAGAELHPRTREANVAAFRLHTRVTPTFLVNGQLVEGALPLAQFRELIEGALKAK